MYYCYSWQQACFCNTVIKRRSHPYKILQPGCLFWVKNLIRQTSERFLRESGCAGVEQWKIKDRSYFFEQSPVTERAALRTVHHSTLQVKPTTTATTKMRCRLMFKLRHWESYDSDLRSTDEEKTLPNLTVNRSLKNRNMKLLWWTVV